MKCKLCKNMGILTCAKCYTLYCHVHIQLESHICPYLSVKQTIKLPEPVVKPKLEKI